jgi:hypothetical protein
MYMPFETFPLVKTLVAGVGGRGDDEPLERGERLLDLRLRRILNQGPFAWLGHSSEFPLLDVVVSLSANDIEQVATLPLSGPSISVATPVDSACDDGEDADLGSTPWSPRKRAAL